MPGIHPVRLRCRPTIRSLHRPLQEPTAEFARVQAVQAAFAGLGAELCAVLRALLALVATQLTHMLTIEPTASPPILERRYGSVFGWVRNGNTATVRPLLTRRDARCVAGLFAVVINDDLRVFDSWPTLRPLSPYISVDAQY